MHRARVALIGVVSALSGFALAVWLFPGRDATPGMAAGPADAPARSAAGAAPAAPAAGELRVEPGGTLVLEAAKLEPGRPVVLHLGLGEPSRSDEPRPVHIVAADGSRGLEGQGRLGSERLDARFEVDPAFLLPGRYMVEVKTTEQSHFPLRRYVIEVR